MESLSRVKTKQKEKEKQRKNAGLTTLRLLWIFSRVMDLIIRAWNFLKEEFNDWYL